MRRSTRKPDRSAAIASTFALLVVIGIGCSSESSSADDDRAPHTYTVRGQVKAVSVETKELQFHHEAIPTFVNAKGKQTGMMAMVMPFHVLDDVKGVKLAELAAGDKVEIAFSTHWKTRPTLRITSITRLTPETELEF